MIFLTKIWYLLTISFGDRYEGYAESSEKSNPDSHVYLPTQKYLYLELEKRMDIIIVAKKKWISIQLQILNQNTKLFIV